MKKTVPAPTLAVMTEMRSLMNEQYGWRKFRFGLPLPKLSVEDTYDTLPAKHRDNWVWRYLVASVIVSGSNEYRMQRICNELFRQYPTPSALAAAELQDLYRMFGRHNLEYGGMKAQRIVAICAAVVANKNRVWRSKEKLMELRGVGEHIAEVIMATCYGETQHFAVDIHVKVIAKRWGISATQLRKIPLANAQWSRNFVDFGQNICGKQPNCKQCFVATQCQQMQKFSESK